MLWITYQDSVGVPLSFLDPHVLIFLQKIKPDGYPLGHPLGFNGPSESIRMKHDYTPDTFQGSEAGVNMKDIGDLAMGTSVLGSLAGYLPDIATILAIIWAIIRIYEWMRFRVFGVRDQNPLENPKGQ